MQIRCTYCQTMFAVGREEMLAALEQMEEENLKFFAAHCPKCRRANRIERLKLEFSYPGWKNDIKKLAKEPAAAAPVAPVKEEVEPQAGASRKKHLHKPAAPSGSAPKAKVVKAAPAKKTTAAKAKAVVKTTASKVSKAPAKAGAKAVKKPAAGTKKK